MLEESPKENHPLSNRQFQTSFISPLRRMGQQRDHAALERAETPFDLALGLRGWCHEMGYLQSAQRALELADGIGAVVDRTRAKQAQRIRVDGQRQSPFLEEATEPQSLANLEKNAKVV